MTSTNAKTTQAISTSPMTSTARSEDQDLTTRSTHLHKPEINSDTDRCIPICRGDAPLSRRGHRTAAVRRPAAHRGPRKGSGRC